MYPIGGIQHKAARRGSTPGIIVFMGHGEPFQRRHLGAADWAEKRQLRLVKTVQYTKDAEAGV